MTAVRLLATDCFKIELKLIQSRGLLNSSQELVLKWTFHWLPRVKILSSVLHRFIFIKKKHLLQCINCMNAAVKIHYHGKKSVDQQVLSVQKNERKTCKNCDQVYWVVSILTWLNSKSIAKRNWIGAAGFMTI